MTELRSRRTATLRRLFGIGALMAVGWFLTAVPAVAEMTEHTVPTDLEAWYTVTPLASPGLPPVTTYPADTLHVGVTGGAEDARTYLSLDVAALPTGGTIVGGTLTLPIDLEDGTRGAEESEVVACAAADPGPDVEGSLEPPPEVDCTRSSPASYVDGDRPVLEIDLAPLADVLVRGGLALLPDPDTETPAASWHVAFHGRDSEAENARPITASLDVDVVIDDDGPAVAGPPITSPSANGGTFTPPATSPPSFSLPDSGLPGQLPDATPDVAADPLPSDSGSGSDTPALVAATDVPLPDGGFRYSMIFVLPFALAAFVWYFGGALTRDGPRV